MKWLIKDLDKLIATVELGIKCEDVYDHYLHLGIDIDLKNYSNYILKNFTLDSAYIIDEFDTFRLTKIKDLNVKLINSSSHSACMDDYKKLLPYVEKFVRCFVTKRSLQLIEEKREN